MSRSLDPTQQPAGTAGPPASRAGAQQAQIRFQRFLVTHTKAVMTRSVLTVSPQLTLKELEHLFETHDFNGFPVVEDHRLAGIVTKFDFLKAFVFTSNAVFPHYDLLMKRTVQEIMTTKVCTVHPTMPLTRVLQLMVETRDKSFPVVDEKKRLVGMISRGDIVRALKD